jgi:hypothetical protein
MIDCQVSSHLTLATCSPHSPLNIAGLLTLETCSPQLSRQTLCLARQYLGDALASEFEENLRARRCRFEVAAHLFPAPLYYILVGGEGWGLSTRLETPPHASRRLHTLRGVLEAWGLSTRLPTYTSRWGGLGSLHTPPAPPLPLSIKHEKMFLVCDKALGKLRGVEEASE